MKHIKRFESFENPNAVERGIEKVKSWFGKKDKIDTNISDSDFKYIEDKIRTYLEDNNLSDKYLDVFSSVIKGKKKVKFGFMNPITYPDRMFHGCYIQPINTSRYVVLLLFSEDWKFDSEYKTIEDAMEYITIRYPELF